MPTVSSPGAKVVYIRRHKRLEWANGVEVVIGRDVKAHLAANQALWRRRTLESFGPL